MNRLSELRRSVLMQQAERLLHDEGMMELPVDLKSLAKTRDIVIKPLATPTGGVSGMLTRYGNTYGILYDASIRNVGYQRFSIAHELGHFFVDGHVDHIPFDGKFHRSSAGFVSNDHYEREADYFAAGLLMPMTLIRGVMRGQPDGLNCIKTVQHRARSSLTASAIRYVCLTDIAAAVIISRNGNVDYCFMSKALKSFPNLTWLRKGAQIPAGTATESLMQNPSELRSGAHEQDETDITEWFGGTRSPRALEEVVGLGNYNRVLTVLTCPDLVDEGFQDEDEESDEAMEERWTPRFR